MRISQQDIQANVKGNTLSLQRYILNEEDISKILIYLNEHRAITSLDLSHTFISDESARLLASNETLTSLNLSDSNIFNSGAKALADNKTLTSLNLSFNSISDEGAKTFAANKTLISLNLSNSRWYIGDDTATALIANKTLASVDLSNNSISRRNLKALADKQTTLFQESHFNVNNSDQQTKSELDALNEMSRKLRKMIDETINPSAKTAIENNDDIYEDNTSVLDDRHLFSPFVEMPNIYAPWDENYTDAATQSMGTCNHYQQWNNYNNVGIQQDGNEDGPFYDETQQDDNEDGPFYGKTQQYDNEDGLFYGETQLYDDAQQDEYENHYKAFEDVEIDNDTPQSNENGLDISMLVLKGFSTVLGITAVAIAFTVFNTASLGIGIPGSIVAGASIAATLGVIGLFADSAYRSYTNTADMEDVRPY